MPRQIRRDRGSLWPVVLFVVILAGAIDIGVHLHRW
jgi:hypothetical protein